MEEAIQTASSDSKFEGVDFDVQWKPFELDATLVGGRGKDKMTSYTEKFGRAKIESMIPYMKQVGRECGIAFSYGGNIGNTFDSHRLIRKARQQGGSARQDTMVENLFRAYFEHEQTLSDSEVLRKCAEESGVTPLVDEDEGREETREEMASFRRHYRTNGVPFFVLDGKTSLSGAQPAEEFLAAFHDLVVS